MIYKIFSAAAIISVFWFPWPLTAVLALSVSPFEPFIPLAAGVAFDLLYYAPHSGAFPYFTLFGAAATILAFFVRSRLKASIIRE